MSLKSLLYGTYADNEFGYFFYSMLSCQMLINVYYIADELRAHLKPQFL